MSNVVIFRGVKIRYFDCRRKEASHFTRLHLTADATEAVADAMEWEWRNGLLPVGHQDAGLAGELQLTNIQLSVAGLEKNDLDIQADKMASFEAVRQKTEADGEQVLLRFIVWIPVNSGLIDDYWRNYLGEGEAQMRVHVLAEQPKLVDQPEGPDAEKMAATASAAVEAAE